MWAVTVGIVVLLITFEFVQSTRNPHEVQIREAAIQSIIYVAIAIAFGVFFSWWSADQMPPQGGSYGLEYFAGWLIEKSLSVDNLFVFVIIMSAFAVPKIYQQKVLMAGIAGALVLRTIFIFIGAAALEAFSFTYVIFGAFLMYTAIGLARHRNEEPEFNEGKVVRLAKRVLPFTDEYDGAHLHTRVNGKLFGTPLLMVMIAIFATDIIFALDSIPAVYGVTNEPFIVFAANAFALLGLRALYFLVAGLLGSSGLSLPWPGRDPGVHRGETDPGVLRHPHRHLGLPGHHHRDPGDHDGRLVAQGPQGPVRQCPRRGHPRLREQEERERPERPDKS